jgi:hypothetical protein
MEFDSEKINRLIHLFMSQGGIVTSVDERTRTYGYSHEGRHIIPITWRGLKLEIVVSNKTILQHAAALDFTNGARYLSVKTLTYAKTPGIYASVDIARRIIQTIVDAHVSFLHDPRRIFRAIKMMVDENLLLSTECYNALQDIFEGDRNAFITHISLRKIYHRMNVMLETGHAALYFEVFDKLGIFNKLCACFSSRHDASSAYYYDILEPFRFEFARRREQAQMQHPGSNLYTMYGNIPSQAQHDEAGQDYFSLKQGFR